MKTRVIAFDVYGTMLPSKGEQVKRKGLDTLLKKCKEAGFILCTCSDADTSEVLSDFAEADLDASYFDYHFQMERKSEDFTNEPKNFAPILSYYKIRPRELHVVGDREKRDIRPALELGCKVTHVPEYKTLDGKDEFDLGGINV